MVKYRKLKLEELNHLEKEFVEYLVVNGITADDWVELKENEKEKAERIIDLFSDVVFENILRKAQYLEFRSKKEIYAYQCLPKKIVLVGVTVEQNSSIDFSTKGWIKKITDSPDAVKIFTTDKKYSQPREAEIFNMLQAGCEISDGELFKKLCLIL